MIAELSFTLGVEMLPMRTHEPGLGILFTAGCLKRLSRLSLCRYSSCLLRKFFFASARLSGLDGISEEKHFVYRMGCPNQRRAGDNCPGSCRVSLHRDHAPCHGSLLKQESCLVTHQRLVPVHGMILQVQRVVPQSRPSKCPKFYTNRI